MKMKKAAQKVVLGLIRVYQLWISPLKIFFGAAGGSCRYYPTCSDYAAQAVEKHGAVKGFFLALGRIMRCHPWGGQGYDPVPVKSEKKVLCACGQEMENEGS
jgi:uncharacterized protein